MIAAAILWGASAFAEPPDPVDLQAPLLALQEARFDRHRRAVDRLFAAAATEIALGAAVALAGDGEGGGAAGALVLGGALHGATAYAELGDNARRDAAFAAGVLDIAGAPDEAWLHLAEQQRLAHEREARTNAFATGLHGSLIGLGALAALTADGAPRVREAGLGLVLVGGVGVVHHGSRWRAGVRFANDHAVLPHRVPTALP